MARYVTVATVSHRGGGYGWPHRSYTDTAARLADAEHYAVRARRMGADIVAFPEIYPVTDVPREKYAEVAEALPDGPTFRHMAGVARREGMYILWPTFRRDGDYLFNSAVLFDRQGQVAGIYDKVVPTMWEIDWGVTPGRGPVVIETDFGRVGVVICYDSNFGDLWEETAKAGAEIIFFPSASRGGLILRSWAYHLRVYVASAILNDLGQIVDPLGDVLAESTYEAVALARINLDYRVLHTDFCHAKWDQILARYGTGVTLKWHTREGKFLIASEMADVTAADLMREFELEDLEDYLARARAYRDAALEHPKPIYDRPE